MERRKMRRPFVQKPFDWMPVIELKELGTCKHPKKADRQSIGYDLCVPETVIIPAHSRVIVPTNISIKSPASVEAKIEPRSGFSAKGIEGLGTRSKWILKWGWLPWRVTESGIMRFDADVINGKVDPGYKGNIGVIVKNNDVQFAIQAGTRIAQMTFYRVLRPSFVVVDELSGEDRGGGFGHSGTTVNSTK